MIGFLLGMLVVLCMNMLCYYIGYENGTDAALDKVKKVIDEIEREINDGQERDSE